MQAGERKARVTFSKRVGDQDEFGQTEHEWVVQFSRWASIAHRRGGEGVLAARLEGKALALVTVPADTETKLITSNWKFTVGGVNWFVKEPPAPDGRGHLQFHAQTGIE